MDTLSIFFNKNLMNFFQNKDLNYKIEEENWVFLITDRQNR